jgi:hypothetical protein
MFTKGKMLMKLVEYYQKDTVKNTLNRVLLYHDQKEKPTQDRILKVFNFILHSLSYYF